MPLARNISPARQGTQYALDAATPRFIYDAKRPITPILPAIEGDDNRAAIVLFNAQLSQSAREEFIYRAKLRRSNISPPARAKES